MRSSISLATLAMIAGCGASHSSASAPAPQSPTAREPAPDPAGGPVDDTGGAGSSAAAVVMPGAEYTAADPYGGMPLAEPASAGGARGQASSPGAWVDAHNRWRARHCAAPLRWSAKLAEIAQRWANSLRDRSCAFGHSGGSYGENLAAGTAGTLDPVSVVKMWYDEVAQYRFPDGGFSMKTGHFTQVVWRRTSQVGCATSRCKGMDIFVCEYDPAGNWEGQYRENVLPRGCGG